MSVTTLAETLLPRVRRVMAKKAKEDQKPTTTVRLHKEDAELVSKLASIFNEHVADFLGRLLRPILEEKRREAVEILKKWPPKPE
jgi:hypothetical protein